MLVEMLVAAFVVTFVAIALYGHVLVAQALVTPDQSEDAHIGW